MTRVMAAAGLPREDVTVSPVTFEEMRPGCYEPKARLADMDEAGIEASLNFPTFPRFAGQAFSEANDKELGFACIALPAAMWLGHGGVERALLAGPVLLILIVELLNSAIEATVDRIGLERHVLAGLAKDIGSAAVMLSFILLGVIWLLVLLAR